MTAAIACFAAAPAVAITKAPEVFNHPAPPSQNHGAIQRDDAHVGPPPSPPSTQTNGDSPMLGYAIAIFLGGALILLILSAVFG